MQKPACMGGIQCFDRRPGLLRCHPEEAMIKTLALYWYSQRFSYIFLINLNVLSVFSVCNIWVEESHLSCLLEIWELPWEKDLGLFSICSSEKQQKYVIKPAFIEFYWAAISVILGILDSLHGLGASVEEDEKHKKKAAVVYYNNAIIITCSVCWGVTSPGLSAACSRGERHSGGGQLPVHLPEMMQLEVAPLSKLSHDTEKHEHKK